VGEYNNINILFWARRGLEKGKKGMNYMGKRVDGSESRCYGYHMSSNSKAVIIEHHLNRNDR
jgi:hypothetical protein